MKTSKVKYKIKSNLAVIRINLGFSQEDIARKAFLSVMTYRKIELKRTIPSLSSALLISKALGEDIGKLFSIEIIHDLDEFEEDITARHKSGSLNRYQKKLNIT